MAQFTGYISLLCPILNTIYNIISSDHLCKLANKLIYPPDIKTLPYFPNKSVR